MRRYHLRRALRAANLTRFEEGSALTGVLLIVMAAIAAVAVSDAGGDARQTGIAGLVALLVCATSRGVRAYRAGVTASLPTAIGRTRVRIRPARGFGITTAALALGVPLAAGAAVVACVEFAWVLVAGVVTLGCAGALVSWLRADDDPWTDRPSSCLAAELLSRLCMRADMPAPELVVEPGAAANAWTLGGRIHITSALLNALDEGELEAVLAHELAHLARRDAAVMDICSAPSRILLTFAGAVSPRLKGATRGLLSLGAPLGIPAAMWLLAALTVPPAFVVGWLSRLSMLGMSRAREFAADAAAVALTGRPSALASALRKLDDQGARVARSDLRQVEAVAVLCIVGAASSRLGRLLRTHPPTAARVKRLEAIERRLQAKRSS